MQDPRSCSKGDACSCSNTPPARPEAGVDRRKFLKGTAAAAAIGGAAAAQDPRQQRAQRPVPRRGALARTHAGAGRRQEVRLGHRRAPLLRLPRLRGRVQGRERRAARQLHPPDDLPRLREVRTAPRRRHGARHGADGVPALRGRAVHQGVSVRRAAQGRGRLGAGRLRRLLRPRACKEACPYGAIYIDPVANQAIKCHNCTHRVDVGMEPACVSTCPSEALYFGDLNDPDSTCVEDEGAARGRGKRSSQLRPEKGPSRACAFVTDSEDRPMAEWEPKVPREGESYGSPTPTASTSGKGGAE